jgi:hypothetical protein
MWRATVHSRKKPRGRLASTLNSTMVADCAMRRFMAELAIVAIAQGLSRFPALCLELFPPYFAYLIPEEYEIMKSHAALGENILEPVKVKAIECIRRMVRHHHEFYDGTRLPRRLRGKDIPVGARILSAADWFDTMVTDRACKKGRSIEEAARELERCRGTQFEAALALVDVFVGSPGTEREPSRRVAPKPTLV